ncbi:rubredoxin-like domain-containing protein [Halobacteriaceae archaeon GCM10025711]
MSDDPATDEVKIGLGHPVFNEDGEKLGTIRGANEDGFFVTTREGIEAMSVAHERAGHDFAQGELMWRCASCGELGDISDIPDTCPSCGAPKEEIYYYIDD